MFEHAIEKGEQFVPGSGKGRFRRLASSIESVIEGPDDGVMTFLLQPADVGLDVRVVGSRCNSGEGTAGLVVRSYRYQGSYVPIGQSLKLGQSGQESEGEPADEGLCSEMDQPGKYGEWANTGSGEFGCSSGGMSRLARVRHLRGRRGLAGVVVANPSALRASGSARLGCRPSSRLYLQWSGEGATAREAQATRVWGLRLRGWAVGCCLGATRAMLLARGWGNRVAALMSMVT